MSDPIKELPASVKTLITKVARLMREGSSTGERFAAKAALLRIANTHGIDVNLLGLRSGRETRLVAISQDESLALITKAIIQKHFPECELRASDEISRVIGWDVYQGQFTPLEHSLCAELVKDYGVAWVRHQKEALAAFLNVQGLIPEHIGAGVSPTTRTPEQESWVKRVQAKMGTIDKVQIGKVKLENKK